MAVEQTPNQVCAEEEKGGEQSNLDEFLILGEESGRIPAFP